MAHRNARLTPITRLELVGEVAAGWSQAEVARQFRVSRATVVKWLRRRREAGAAGLEDRSSAPHGHPRRAPPELERRICAARRRQGVGPHRIGWALGVACSTVYAVLRRAGLNRLDRMHRVTRRVVRYEHPAPGDLLHLDVKKLGRCASGAMLGPCSAALAGTWYHWADDRQPSPYAGRHVGERCPTGRHGLRATLDPLVEVRFLPRQPRSRSRDAGANRPRPASRRRARTASLARPRRGRHTGKRRSPIAQLVERPAVNR